MSLINDALKRARQAQDSRPSAAAGPPLQPAAPLASAPSLVLWLAAALLVLLLSCWFLFLWWRGSHRLSGPAMPNREIAARPIAPAKAVPALVDPLGSNSITSATAAALTNSAGLLNSPSVSGSATSSATNQAGIGAAAEQRLDASSHSLAGAITNLASADPVPIERPWPVLKLQGIFYGASKASTLINGQTLFIGDDIEGAKVLSIERHAVRLVLGARTNVLDLR